MARWGSLVLPILAVAFIWSCEGARKINVQEQMMRARRSRSLSELSRSRRDEIMGLGEGEELKPGKQVHTAKGTTKVKFQETYDGIPIVGATVVFEEDENGGITSDVSGHLVAGVDDDIPSVKPSYTASEVFSMVALKNQDNPNSVQFDPEKDATLEVILEDSIGETTSAKLAYKLSYRVEKKGRLSRPSFLVDANTGDVINQWEGLSFQKLSKKAPGNDRVHSNYDFQTVGGNLKIGKAKYDGKSYPKLEITKDENGNCSLANNVAKVFNCEKSWHCYDEAQVPYTFDCEKGLTDGVNGAYSPLADALYYISATYEMFNSWYDIKDPLKRTTSDTESSVCGARIHFGSAFENAFWDGYFITFGDGNDTFYPLTSINVVAHEIAHGITEMNSGLIYQGESGGINEAFSDMAGEAVEFYANSKPDWMVGYEIFKHPDKALRYFNDPQKDGRSISHYNQYCPGIDVHFSSGVFNRAFYFLGKTEGWNVKKAFKPFVVANVLYWVPISRFYQAACDVVRAANDLGYNGNDVTEAFRKVGVEPCEDRSTGILVTSEINVPAGHEILIHVDITKDMDLETMEIMTFGGRMAMNVRTPNCDFCSRRTSYEGKMEICDVAPGLYEISLIPDVDLLKGAVLITGKRTNIFSNGTLKSFNDTIEFEFEMPAAAVKSGGQVLMEITTEYGYPVAVVRHGTKPNIESYEFDFHIQTGHPSLVCALKTGTYYGLLLTPYSAARGVDINIIEILSGKRMDTPPVWTRSTPVPTSAGPTTAAPETPAPKTAAPKTAAPTASPTESGSGSGDDTESGEGEALDFDFSL